MKEVRQNFYYSLPYGSVLTLMIIYIIVIVSDK